MWRGAFHRHQRCQPLFLLLLPLRHPLLSKPSLEHRDPWPVLRWRSSSRLLLPGPQTPHLPLRVLSFLCALKEEKGCKNVEVDHFDRLVDEKNSRRRPKTADPVDIAFAGTLLFGGAAVDAAGAAAAGAAAAAAAAADEDDNVAAVPAAAALAGLFSPFETAFKPETDELACRSIP